MLDAILNIILNNPIISLVFGSAIGTGLFWFFVKFLLKKFVTINNIDFVADYLDQAIDNIQKKDKGTGEELRRKLIILCEDTIKKLKENDGIN